MSDIDESNKTKQTQSYDFLYFSEKFECLKNAPFMELIRQMNTNKA